jgi:hypothetical protein
VVASQARGPGCARDADRAISCGRSTSSFMFFQEDSVRTSDLAAIALSLALSGCVSGAPTLTPAQESQVSRVAIYKVGELPPEKYQAVQTLSAADCSGAPAGGRVWGNAEQAIDTLKRKAVEIDADAVVNVSCSSAPMLNNCWAAQKCSGEAVKIERTEHN